MSGKASAGRIRLSYKHPAVLFSEASDGATLHQLRYLVSDLFHVAIAATGGQADLRPALFDYLLLLAAACRGTT